MNVGSTDVLLAVGLVYEAAVNPARWPEALQCVADVVEGGAAVIALGDERFGEASITYTSPRISPAALEEYQAQYAVHDRTGMVLAAPAGKILTDEDVWPDRTEFAANPVVSWRSARFGLPHSWGMSLNGGDGWNDALFVQCGDDAWPPSERSRAAAELLFPHLARALRLSRLRAIMRARYRQVLAALDKVVAGVVILDREGRVAVVNEEARRILDARATISINGGRLQAQVPCDDAVLQAKIRAALAVANATAITTGGGPVRLRCRFGGPASLVEVGALRDGTGLLGAYITVLDLAQPDSFVADGLDVIYGLTEAEMAVCRLLATGASNGEIADARGASEFTVKAQVGSVLSKTGSANRTALLRLMFKVNPPLRD